MKNEISTYSPNKKQFVFKPKNTKIKKEDLNTVLNKILKKPKEEEKNSKSKENIKNTLINQHQQQEKTHHKKIQYDKSKNKKISKSSLSNHKTKNSINETNNNINSNKPPKKFFLNINEEKPQLLSSKKNNNQIKRPNTREINNKKLGYKLKSSKSKRDMNTTDSDSAEKSSRSTKQIKPFHMKKDFYVPTVCASLISPKQKNSNSSLNYNLENSFSSHSSYKNIGKGSFKFNEKRKKHIIQRYHTMTNSINDNKDNSNLSDSVNYSLFNYDKVLNDLNCISVELSSDKKDESVISRNGTFSSENKRINYIKYGGKKYKSLNEIKN